MSVFAGLAALAAVFVAGFASLAAGLAAVFEAAVLVAFEAGAVSAAGMLVAGVFAGLTAFALLAGLFALLAGASPPQAMPRALRPRTVESAITFFISLLRLLFLLKVFSRFRELGRSNTAFCSKLFLSQSKR